MVTGTAFFEAAAAYNDAPVKSGLCSICKGAHRLCGKDRCPLMIKFYSQQKTRPLIDAKDLAGSSPPSVFVGRYGYPKVDIGPLVPPEFGDTSVMGRPEMWVGKSIDEIVDMRFRLVRGKYRIDATDFAKYGRMVDAVQEVALAERPIDIETTFSQKPRGRVVLDDDIEPFAEPREVVLRHRHARRGRRGIGVQGRDPDLRDPEGVLRGNDGHRQAQALRPHQMEHHRRRRHHRQGPAEDHQVEPDHRRLQALSLGGAGQQMGHPPDALHLEVRAHRGVVSQHHLESHREDHRRHPRQRVLRGKDRIRAHRRLLLRIPHGGERAPHQGGEDGGCRHHEGGPSGIRHARRGLERQGERPRRPEDGAPPLRDLRPGDGPRGADDGHQARGMDRQLRRDEGLARPEED